MAAASNASQATGQTAFVIVCRIVGGELWVVEEVTLHNSTTVARAMAKQQNPNALALASPGWPPSSVLTLVRRSRSVDASVLRECVVPSHCSDWKTAK